MLREDPIKRWENEGGALLRLDAGAPAARSDERDASAGAYAAPAPTDAGRRRSMRDEPQTSPE